MKNVKKELEALLYEMKKGNEALCASLTDTVRLDSYAPANGVWTSALQAALCEHEVVIIPSSCEPYLIDGSVLIPSNRHIIAENGAKIKLAHGTRVLMMRSSNTADGTHHPIIDTPRNENITVEGGIWEDWCPHRMGYGDSGMYDSERSFFGVSTYMLLENINHLTLKNMTFSHCGGFGVQIGEVTDAVIENIKFEQCYADGIHINGNTRNFFISNISGEVGDDLVAFNMFDWQNSSINFGPCENVICQDLTLSPKSGYKALRIEPGIYTFDDGTEVDCSLTRAIFRRISGIKTFKLYCQTPVYSPSSPPEKAGVGSGDLIFFEDIKIDLDSPIDLLNDYVTSNPVTGSFGAFELGLNIKRLFLERIDLTLHREKYPYSYLVCIGPKSVRLSDGREVFDPYFSSVADNLYLKDITVNGKRPPDISPYIREIVFDRLYDDIESSASGSIKKIHYE